MMYYAFFGLLALTGVISYLAYRWGRKIGHIDGYHEGYDQSATDLAAITSYYETPR